MIYAKRITRFFVVSRVTRKQFRSRRKILNLFRVKRETKAVKMRTNNSSEEKKIETVKRRQAKKKHKLFPLFVDARVCAYFPNMCTAAPLAMNQYHFAFLMHFTFEPLHLCRVTRRSLRRKKKKLKKKRRRWPFKYKDVSIRFEFIALLPVQLRLCMSECVLIVQGLLIALSLVSCRDGWPGVVNVVSPLFSLLFIMHSCFEGK